MSERPNQNADRMRAEQLAAYVDGELGADARTEFEEWLADHPDAISEVEALRGLDRIWQSATIAEPSEDEWNGVLSGIEGGLGAAIATTARPRRRMAWALVGAIAATAAAIVVAVILTRPTPTTVQDQQPLESISLVSADDVDIERIDPADAKSLVVGDTPVREPLALLMVSEVSVDDVKSGVQGMNPVFPRDGATAPMIIMEPRDEK